MNKKIEEFTKEYSDLLKEKKTEFIQYSESFLKRNFEYGRNFNKDKILKNEIGKIYFVSGILHLAIKTKVWKKTLKKEFPEMDTEFFDTIFYVHMEKRKINKIISELKISLEKTLANKNFNQKIIIFGHSFGGILSQTAISRLPKQLQKRIVLVTLGTPHSMNHGGVSEARKYLKTPADLKNTKVFTFGGVYDMVVPAKFSHTKQSHAQDILSDHMMFLHSKKTLKKVFAEVFID